MQELRFLTYATQDNLKDEKNEERERQQKEIKIKGEGKSREGKRVDEKNLKKRKSRGVETNSCRNAIW